MNTIVRYLMAFTLHIIALSLPHNLDNSSISANKKHKEMTEDISQSCTTSNEKKMDNTLKLKEMSNPKKLNL